MGCQYLDEFYELALLGATTSDAGREVREHLERGCPYCVERAREAALTIFLLVETLRPRRPSPKLKARVLKRLQKK